MGFSWGNIASKLRQHAETAAPFAKAAAPFAATAMFPGGAIAAPLALQLLKKGQQRAAASEPGPAPEEHEDSLQSLVGYCGEEELELARSGGAAERQSLQRRRRMSGMGAGVPHEVYRAAIWQRATKLAGGEKPQARHIFHAQKTVDRDLNRKGSTIVIPGARPGRVTR